MWSPAAIGGHPSTCGGVGAAKVEPNHSRTGGENRASGSTGCSGAMAATLPSVPDTVPSSIS